MSNTLLRVCPSELKIPFELKKQNSCCMQLINKTDQYVAFKVKTTNPRKYSVRPTSGVVLPRSSCNVTVTMQAPKEIPSDYHCKDKFLVQSIVARDGAMAKEVVSDMFIRAPGKVVEEFKLRVVYIPANPPSPVPEEAEAEEEVSSPRSSVMDYEVKRSSMFDAASSYGDTSREETPYAEGLPVISKLVGERRHAVDENKKLQQELELLRKERRSSCRGFSAIFVLAVFISSVLIGHLIKERKV